MVAVSHYLHIRITSIRLSIKHILCRGMSGIFAMLITNAALIVLVIAVGSRLADGYVTTLAEAALPAFLAVIITLAFIAESALWYHLIAVEDKRLQEETGLFPQAEEWATVPLPLTRRLLLYENGYPATTALTSQSLRFTNEDLAISAALKRPSLV